MDNLDFKKTVGEILEGYGFVYEKKSYYLKNDTLVVAIDFQKSNFSNSYFINYGFLVRCLSPEVKIFKTVACDVRGRFNYYNDDKVYPEFALDDIDDEFLSSSVEKNVKKIIFPVLSVRTCFLSMTLKVPWTN